LAGLESLIAARDSRFVDAERLRREAEDVDRLAPFYDRTATGAAYGAFAELLRIAALLVQWRAAVLTGEADSGRFLGAAKERHRIWKEEAAPTEGAAHVIAAADGLADLSQVAAVNALLTAFANTPLPIGIYASEHRGIRLPTSDDEGEKKAPPPELAVAFLKFAIDGQPASETHFLTPGESHDLELEVRVSRWPEGAKTLELRVITVEAAAAFDFPLFNLGRPDGKPPFMLRERGRAIITAPQGLNARPFEFRYSASFKPTVVEQPVATLGQRTLRIESFDLKVNSLTGYPGLDPKIIEIRDVLRSRFNIPPDDLGAALKLAAALAAYMGRVLQDNEITEVLSEKQLQALVRAELRRRPEIGSALSEHPRAAGGITDLTLLGVPLELKVEGEKRLALENCQQFVGQTTSYAHGNGKRVGVLCVMDCSPKTQAAAPAEACIGILQDETSGVNTPIITVLVQANLAKPSSLSR
jgi:hypothetical protein